MQTYTIDIRPRRQATFPRTLLNQVGLKVGDKLVAQVVNKKIILKPQRQVALDAFAELQRIVQESGVPEKEIQDNLIKIRKEIYAKRYSQSVS
ncbi:AbrB/MazE/SpoVT family DNA-binding domain-containing protein [Candidatus Microgenomates bacterium]|nr:AbrB/MazE/SpoVT family DNA-binding domain-containing protein [Candidatus Microgenomates bacterium]